MNLSAVILAGGQSSRMGLDKALLMYRGEPLILHQLNTLRRLRLQEVLISGRTGGMLTGYGFDVLQDNYPGQGPLAGIERALEVMRGDLLLVLAVDMPKMTPAVLRRLISHAQPGCGVVPVLNDRLEPLAALYPKPAHPLLREFLGEGFNGATHFAECCLRAGLAAKLELPAALGPCFANWNTPADCEPEKTCRASRPRV